MEIDTVQSDAVPFDPLGVLETLPIGVPVLGPDVQPRVVNPRGGTLLGRENPG